MDSLSSFVGSASQDGHPRIELIDLSLLTVGPADDREQRAGIDDAACLTVRSFDGIANPEEVMRFELSAHGSATRVVGGNCNLRPIPRRCRSGQLPLVG